MKNCFKAPTMMQGYGVSQTVFESLWTVGKMDGLEMIP